MGFISTLAAARPVLHHYMEQNREIPQEIVKCDTPFCLLILPWCGGHGILPVCTRTPRGSV